MKRFLKRHWPLLGVGVLLATVASYLVGAGKSGISKSLFRGIFSEEGLRLKDIHYTQDDPEAGLKWILDAREVRFSEDRQRIAFKKFHLRLEPQDRPWFELTGKQGDYSRRKGEIRLQGDLAGLSEDGYRIYTERMLINEKLRSMRTNAAVKILGPFFTVSGQGLAADLQAETVQILSDVTTVVEKESFS
jgi:LPS export ABC transporter protein LptC